MKEKVLGFFDYVGFGIDFLRKVAMILIFCLVFLLLFPIAVVGVVSKKVIGKHWKKFMRFGE